MCTSVYLFLRLFVSVSCVHSRLCTLICVHLRLRVVNGVTMCQPVEFNFLAN